MIPRERWRFARVEGGRVVPDAGHIHLDGGFEKGRLYQITYTAEGAPVLGLAMAALRDSVAWLKHGGADDGQSRAGARSAGPTPTDARRPGGCCARSSTRISTSTSRGARRSTAIIANVAGGMRGEFNQRFGQNSKDRNNMMAHLFPFTDQPPADPETGAKDALHARLDARGSRLRVFYTNTSAEYHRGDASLIHTDPDGARDVAHGPNARVYHFAGTEHGLGIWPPTDSQLAAADPTGPVERSQNLRGVVDYSALLRACLVNLDRWVMDGVEPPPSRHPRLADGTAVPPDALAPVFARIPAARYPRHHARPRRLDWSTLPPTAGPALRLARLRGRRRRQRDRRHRPAGDRGAARHAYRLEPAASRHRRRRAAPGLRGRRPFPFARTRAEREATGDPRPSIAERYASREDYLERVRQAAEALARAGYLLADDVPLSVAAGARFWDQFTR